MTRQEKLFWIKWKNAPKVYQLEWKSFNLLNK